MNMNRIHLKIFLPAVALFISAAVISGCSDDKQVHTAGIKLYEQAQSYEKSSNYIKAYSAYRAASDQLLSEGKANLARQCRLGRERAWKVKQCYSVPDNKAFKQIKNKYPQLKDDRIHDLLSKADSILMDGKQYYFSGFMNTVENLDTKLILSDKNAISKITKASEVFRHIINKKVENLLQPYSEPVSYKMAGNLRIPQEELPAYGILKVWVPIPIVTGPQQNIKIKKIVGRGIYGYPVNIDGDIGLSYFEVPLDKLNSDLNYRIEFDFDHYWQNFSGVVASSVGEYDKGSSLYKEYTASKGNIYISGDITSTARKIVSGEKNPYLAAKKIYEYVVDKTTYSLMPHTALNAYNLPESVYVQKHKYGDCGAQSIYFSALCRAVGIPARTTGGFQMINSKTNGAPSPHFWAEFYIPNYGWIPVDTSVAQFYKIFSSIWTKEEALKFKNYYFGNMDPYRYIIQKDVDVPLNPPATEPVLLPMAIQMPAAVCATMDESPSKFIDKYWTLTIKKAPK